MVTTELAVGDRVATTQMIRLWTHDGMVEKPPGVEGVVTAIWDTGEVRCDVGRGMRPYNVGFRPDELRLIRREGAVDGNQ